MTREELQNQPIDQKVWDELSTVGLDPEDETTCYLHDQLVRVAKAYAESRVREAKVSLISEHIVDLHRWLSTGEVSKDVKDFIKAEKEDFESTLKELLATNKES